MRLISNCCALAAVAVSLWSSAVAAQTTVPTGIDAPAAADKSSDDIVVTARRRDETLISVPVVVSVVGGAEMERRGINNLDALAQSVPGLQIGPSQASVQGGTINIRGISGPADNPFGDSAVAFNVDGVVVSKANVRRLSQWDIAQIEVLKGPQALFYGKNSPAGIVTIRTADPTDHFEAKLATGYEFKAREVRVEGYVSGPLTDTLGARVSGSYSHMQGYFKDLISPTSPYFVDDRSPRVRDMSMRGTLKWEPSSDLNARFKFNYSNLHTPGPVATSQNVTCSGRTRRATDGLPQCSAGGSVSNAGYGPAPALIPASANIFAADGDPFLRETQMLSSAEINYSLTDQLRLTSTTGYYYVRQRMCGNYMIGDVIILPSCHSIGNKELTQEFRLATDFDGPLNFTTGALAGRTQAYVREILYLYGGSSDLLAPGVGGPTTPAMLGTYWIKQKGKVYSGYLQMSYKPVSTVEVNLGGRYTYEQKSLPIARSGGGINEGRPPAPILTSASELQLAKRRDHWNDFSPEATVSYRPNNNLTIFTSYKHGFLSGGFNSAANSFETPNLDLSYDPQTVKGFEAGVKAQLGKVRVSASAYSYKVKDLQQTVITVNGGNIATALRNVGSVSTKGGELELSWDTPITGLGFTAAAAYNNGKYTSYANAPCYGGQTAAQGCVIEAGGQPAQDLSGTTLLRAPKWILQGGFHFETDVGTGMKFGVSSNVNYSSSYLTQSASAPTSRMPKYALVDGTVRLMSAEDSWEAAIIGRNLTNKYYYTATSDLPFAPGEFYGAVSRGREIMLRLSYKL